MFPWFVHLVSNRIAVLKIVWCWSAARMFDLSQIELWLKPLGKMYTCVHCLRCHFFTDDTIFIITVSVWFFFIVFKIDWAKKMSKSSKNHMNLSVSQCESCGWPDTFAWCTYMMICDCISTAYKVSLVVIMIKTWKPDLINLNNSKIGAFIALRGISCLKPSSVATLAPSREHWNFCCVKLIAKRKKRDFFSSKCRINRINGNQIRRFKDSVNICGSRQCNRI